MSGTIVLLPNTGQKSDLGFHFLPTLIFGHIEEKFIAIKLSVSILGQTIGYWVYTVSRESMRLPPEFDFQYLVFINMKCSQTVHMPYIVIRISCRFFSLTFK